MNMAKLRINKTNFSSQAEISTKMWFSWKKENNITVCVKTIRIPSEGHFCAQGELLVWRFLSNVVSKVRNEAQLLSNRGQKGSLKMKIWASAFCMTAEDSEIRLKAPEQLLSELCGETLLSRCLCFPEWTFKLKPYLLLLSCMQKYYCSFSSQTTFFFVIECKIFVLKRLNKLQMTEIKQWCFSLLWLQLAARLIKHTLYEYVTFFCPQLWIFALWDLCIWPAHKILHDTHTELLWGSAVV